MMILQPFQLLLLAVSNMRKVTIHSSFPKKKKNKKILYLQINGLGKKSKTA